MLELKPCPFCGGTDIRVQWSERTTAKDGDFGTYISRSTLYKCFCAKCSCGTGMMYSELAAREVWNRRDDCGTA